MYSVGPKIMIRTGFLAACLALLVSACASKPALPPPSQTVPDISLDGLWTQQSTTRRDEAGRVLDAIVVPHDRRKPVRIASRSAPGEAARVFLESGKQLKITQTESGLFISFDRSVVETYTFGELRLVKVGPIVAQRSTGWEGNALVVKTLDEEGALLTETYRVQQNVLTRSIRLVHKNDEKLNYRQVFVR